MFIKRCYKLLQCINQCITVVPVNLYTLVMCPRKPLRHRFTTIAGSENTPTFKTLLKLNQRWYHVPTALEMDVSSTKMTQVALRPKNDKTSHISAQKIVLWLEYLCSFQLLLSMTRVPTSNNQDSSMKNCTELISYCQLRQSGHIEAESKFTTSTEKGLVSHQSDSSAFVAQA